MDARLRWAGVHNKTMSMMKSGAVQWHVKAVMVVGKKAVQGWGPGNSYRNVIKLQI